jgi:hypothetical protein
VVRVVDGPTLRVRNDIYSDEIAICRGGSGKLTLAQSWEATFVRRFKQNGSRIA